MTTYPCGCVLDTDPSGVFRSVSKCARHEARRRDPATLGEDYYAELGVVRAGKPAETRHVEELREALGDFPSPVNPYALEVGCGVSPYVGAVRDAGYQYLGTDASPWAVRAMRRLYGSGAACVNDFEDVTPREAYSLLLAAHCLEHMEDAPAAVKKCAGWLVPGGELWVVVPDDSDPVNPDHLFFFTSDSLRACVEAAGLGVVRLEVRRHVKRENFLYLRAKKP